MDMLLVLLGSVLLFSFLGSSNTTAEDSHHDSYEFAQSVDLEALNDLCECKNRVCSCCIEMQNLNACTKMEIIENRDYEEKASYKVKLTVTVNGQVMVTQSFPVSSIPPLCYEADGLEICTKIAIRREMSNFKACASLQLKVNKKLFHEQEMYCIDFPSSMSDAYENNYKIPLGSVITRRRTAKSTVPNVVLGKMNEDRFTFNGNVQRNKIAYSYGIDPPNIIDRDQDYYLWRIDRNDDNNQWADWFTIL